MKRFSIALFAAFLLFGCAHQGLEQTGAWTPASPAAGIQARYLDDAVRTNNAAIDAVFGDLLDAGAAVTSTAAELNLLDGATLAVASVTASAAELNLLDGATLAVASVTASAAELNILDGVTASAAELNILDGVTASAAELNITDGVTATATEINKSSDGVGVTIPRQKIVEIGDWDMDADSTKYVDGSTHGITYSKVVGIRGMVRNDAGTIHYCITPMWHATSSDYPNVRVQFISSTLDRITLIRQTGGSADSMDFNATSYNRGWLVIDYID